VAHDCSLSVSFYNDDSYTGFVEMDVDQV